MSKSEDSIISVDFSVPSQMEKLKVLFDRRIKGSELISVNKLTGGASRSMFRVTLKRADAINEDLILRLYEDGIEVNNFDQLTLSQEAKVARTALHSGIVTPEIIFELVPEDGLGRGYVMAFMSGETLGGRIARSSKYEDARRLLTQQLAESLARIHTIDVSESGLDKAIGSMSPTRAVEGMYKLYLTLKSPVPMVEYAYKWLQQHLPEKYPEVLTHGDFRLGNFLVDKEKGLVGILDWEFTAISDPMRDLAYLCLCPWRYGASLPVGGFGTYEELFPAYEKASGYAVDRERFHFWQVYSCFWWTIACMKMGLSYRDRKGRKGDRIAIGRRSSEGLIDLVNLLIPGEVQLPEVGPATKPERVASVGELISSSMTDLISEVMPELSSRALFLSRVAANNLGIALRETKFGPARDKSERQSINNLLRVELGSVEECRSALCAALESGKVSMDNTKLLTHLRNSVVNDIAIDQPSYAGLAEAVNHKEVNSKK